MQFVVKPQGEPVDVGRRTRSIEKQHDILHGDPKYGVKEEDEKQRQKDGRRIGHYEVSNVCFFGTGEGT